MEMQAQSMAKDMIGGQVVTKTLEFMNDSQAGVNSSSDFQFQTAVLEAGMLGNIVNNMV
jgi:hypothetical protein